MTLKKTAIVRLAESLRTRMFFGAVVLLVGIIFLAYQQYQAQKSLYFEDINAHLNERVASLNRVADSVHFQTMTMVKWVEEALTQKGPLPPHPILTSLKDKSFKKSEADFFERIPSDAQAPDFGNIIGAGSLADLSESARHEIQMAPWLFPLHQAAIKTLPDITWIYYLSNQKFVAISPFKGGEAMVKEGGLNHVPHLFEAITEADFVRLGTPKLNPKMRYYWTDAYLGHVGEGLLVTHGAPIYIGGVHRGIVGVDISLGFLTSMIRSPDLKDGTALVVNEHGSNFKDSLGNHTKNAKHQVLAMHPSQTAIPDQITKYDEALPEGLLPEAISPIINSAGGTVQSNGYIVFAKPLKATPWALLFIVPERVVMAKILPAMIPNILGVVGFIGLILITYAFVRRQVVMPALRLVTHIDKEMQEKSSPIPQVPKDWSPWFESVSEAFASSRRLVSQIEDSADQMHEEDMDFIEKIIAASPVGIGIYLPNGQCISANNSYCTIIGASLEQVLAQNFNDLESWKNSGLYEAAKSATSTKLDVRHEVDIVSTFGKRTCIDCYLVMFSARGKDHLLVMIQDVKDRVEAQAGFLKAKEFAEQANNAKSRFLAAASHDLRQPLHAMRLFAATLIESLQESGTSNKNLGTLKKLDSSIDTLSALLNSLLDISKLESGEVTLNFSDFQIGELLESVVFEHSAEASSKNLNIQFVASSAVVRSDKVLLRRILSNLVSNATRYTSQGRVLLGCRRKGGNLEIQVWDTGIGISAENLDSIFEEFLQLDNPARQRGLGLGLGLAISKKTSDLLGHNLTVSSRPQKGSVFTVEVPLLAAKLPHKAENTISNPLSTHSAKSSVIMVIDDDSLVLEATESLLEQLGYDVIPAISSKDAIEKTTGETVQPDVVIADFRLPGKLNGVDTIRHIKKNVRTNFAGIIITGDTGHESLSVITESGFQVLHKPIQPQKLLTALEEALATT